MKKMPYTKDELYSMGQQRTFREDASEAAFPLGGIGTGNVSLGARGELRDWEIFNRPGKGNRLNYTFFALWAREEGREPLARVLESRIQPPYAQSHGFFSGELAGLPRLEGSEMKGEYPFARIAFMDKELPVDISLEAFTPFIPLNPEDSGIPCAIFRYKLRNRTPNKVDVTVMGSIANAVGYSGLTKFGDMNEEYLAGNINEFRQEDKLSGLYMYSPKFKESYIRYGNMCLLTPEKNVTVKPNWLEGVWWDGIQDMWNDFLEDGLLEQESPKQEVDPNWSVKTRYGSIGVPYKLNGYEEKEFTFILTWYFPNRIKSWYEDEIKGSDSPVVKNYYSKLFRDAWDVGGYVMRNIVRLENDTRKFHKALFSSTLPAHVLDAVSSNMAVIRSTTCFWLENDMFLGYEGCFNTNGCCDGTCTHVWNYAQTLAFLFPSLERSMRRIEFSRETDQKGEMAFRNKAVFEGSGWNHHPATDGQLGTIIRLYREWKLSGDNEFLKEMWDGASRALDFAFTYWDSDGDCVLDSQQHNTYDIEFYGPNSLSNSMFFGALKAGLQMAEAMGDLERAEKYRETLKKGSAGMDTLLWGGEYYIQSIDDVNKHKYQYGTGCLSDQLLGQLLSHIAGLGYILPEEHVKKAVESIYKYNFMTDFNHHQSIQRTYALNDEKGLVLCSWPRGGRPRLPFVYSDEVWTGIEYQVAAHLIYEGFVDEGLTLVKAVRERHDGYRRNPWNEVECGNHYARSMSSWAVLTALTGYNCDMVNKKIKFSPKINKDNFITFWSAGTAWGTYTQKKNHDTGRIEWSIDVLYGKLEDVEIVVDEATV